MGAIVGMGTTKDAGMMVLLASAMVYPITLAPPRNLVIFSSFSLFFILRVLLLLPRWMEIGMAVPLWRIIHANGRVVSIMLIFLFAPWASIDRHVTSSKCGISIYVCGGGVFVCVYFLFNDIPLFQFKKRLGS